MQSTRKDGLLTKAEILLCESRYSWIPKKADLAKCRNFAESSDLTLYKYRNKSNTEKVLADLTIGKLSELAVYHYLKQEFPKISKVDFAQYERHKKSWAPDLHYGEHQFAVKSQTIGAAMRHGISWVFQRSDKIMKAPQPDTYEAIFCLATETDIRVLVRTTVEDVKAKLKPMRLAHLSSKVAAYYSDFV